MTYAKAYLKFGYEIGIFLHLFRPGTMKEIKQKSNVLKVVSKEVPLMALFCHIVSHLCHGDERTVSCIKMAGSLCQDGPHSSYRGRR